MKITVYTINECQFSKAEKEYLQAHNLPYEEKNLESNKEYLTEMLALSSNFAGTPVTKIEKDDGQISVLKGFTKEEFDKLTGVGQPAVTTVNSTMNVPTSPAGNSANTQPAPTTKPVEPPTVPTPVETPKAEQTTPQPPVIQEEPVKSEALNSVLDSLQQKAETTAVPPTPQPPVQPPTAVNPTQPGTTLPNVPEPDFK